MVATTGRLDPRRRVHRGDGTEEVRMTGLDRPTVAWMRDHHSIVTSQVLDDAGISEDERRRLVGLGVLARVVDGGYVFGGCEAGELARCAAVCGSRPHLIVAGPTAGRIWGIRRSPRDDLVHVIAPPASQPCRERWVKPYRTDLVFDDELVTRRDGIRLTSPPRTVVDLTRYVSTSDLSSAIESVIQLGMATPTTLQRTAARLDTPGRAWVRRFLRTLAGRHPGAAAESEWEMRVVNALVARGVHDLERQVEAVLPGYGRVRFDAAIRDLKWALEIDVHPAHLSVEGASKDKRRDRKADAAGWSPVGPGNSSCGPTSPASSTTSSSPSPAAAPPTNATR